MNALMDSPRAPVRTESLRIAGDKVAGDRHFEVRYPYTGDVIAVVPSASVQQVRRAIELGAKFRSSLTRHDRYRILMKAGEIIAKRRDELARLITLESGLCLKDTLYEVGRASDVLLFSANQALVDDGQVFSCDVTPHGRKRKVYTMREPLLGVITAITPFNHPLNQVIHKVAPAIATNNRVVLKPSEKTPLAAYALADILYEAGLPPPMLSVVTGDPREIADELLTNAHVDLVTFTGGVAVGKAIAAKAVYKRQVLELGGNDPIIVMEDADLEEAASLAASGSYKNSGQRCTAVKRMLVQQKVADRFVELLLEKTRALKYGDPLDPSTDMGTVIDEPAAQQFEHRVNEAVAQGAQLLAGNKRTGALYAPTVVDHVKAGHDAGQTGNVRAGIARHPFRHDRRSDCDQQLDRVWPVVRGVHQPARLHHALRFRAAGRHGERARSARIPVGTDAFRRNQGFRFGIQGRCSRSDEKLHQHQDVFPALVARQTKRKRY